jgi:hypothetical protein
MREASWKTGDHCPSPASLSRVNATGVPDASFPSIGIPPPWQRRAGALWRRPVPERGFEASDARVHCRHRANS